MNIVSFIGGSHNRVPKYSTEDLINSVQGMNPDRVIATMDRKSEIHPEEYRVRLTEILDNPSISGLIVDASTDEAKYYGFREKFFAEHSSSVETVVKKNILEMIETTINSYLEGYWKDFETVNSEVTDSLYRSKHKIISTMFWEMELATWNSMMEDLISRVEKLAPGPRDVILVDVEKRYWFVDKLSEA